MFKTTFSRAVAACAGAVALSFSLSACSVDEATDTAASASSAVTSDTLTIFATTGYIADTAKNIAPDADITTMVGPGGDPHTYQPTTQDISKIESADVVLWSGLGMEAQMLDQLRAQGDRQAAVAEAIPEENLLPWVEEEEEGEEGHDHGEAGHDHGDHAYDPHVWNSTENWKYVVDAIVEKLSEVDADNAATYKENGESYKKEIDETAAYVKEQIDQIPEGQRTLITGHDAFNYFGDQFGLTVLATDFVSSESELSLNEINELGTLIAEKKIPVIFQDNLANPQSINSLKEIVESKGWKVEVSDQELYADSLGDSAPTDTYLGVLRYNADAIRDALAK